MSKLTGRNDLQIGQAGEYLVCADLIVLGYDAFLGTQGLPFDVVVRVKDRLLKVQVKTTMMPRTLVGYPPTYLFHIKRFGKGGGKRYPKGMIDIFALVALDIKEVGYLLPEEVVHTRSFRVPGTKYDTPPSRGYYLKDFSFKAALKGLRIKP